MTFRSETKGIETTAGTEVSAVSAMVPTRDRTGQRREDRLRANALRSAIEVGAGSADVVEVAEAFYEFLRGQKAEVAS